MKFGTSVKVSTFIAALVVFAGCSMKNGNNVSEVKSRADNPLFDALDNINGDLRFAKIEINGRPLSVTPDEFHSLSASVSTHGIRSSRSATISLSSGCSINLSTRPLIDGTNLENICQKNYSNYSNVLGVESTSMGIRGRERFAPNFADNSFLAQQQRTEERQIMGLAMVGFMENAGIHVPNSASMALSIASAQEVNFITVTPRGLRIGTEYVGTGVYSVIEFTR